MDYLKTSTIFPWIRFWFVFLLFSPATPSYVPASPNYLPSSPGKLNKMTFKLHLIPNHGLIWSNAFDIYCKNNTLGYSPASPTYSPASPSNYSPSSPRYSPSSPNYRYTMEKKQQYHSISVICFQHFQIFNDSNCVFLLLFSPTSPNYSPTSPNYFSPATNTPGSSSTGYSPSAMSQNTPYTPTSPTNTYSPTSP